MALKPQSTIGKAALGAIAFFTLMRTSVNLAAFDTVVDDLRTLSIVNVPIAPVVVKPQAEEQNKPRP
ncbi:hypothetical protein ACWPKS_10120 [Coraliomargarita sp. W4R72]